MEPTTTALQRPVIVIGAPRSGTTFLLNVLASHPDLIAFNEPRMVWRYGNDRKSDLLRVDDARPEVISYIRGYFSREMLQTGGRRFVEKTPANSLRIPFVNEIFPDARFLITYRNGMDAILSAAYRWDNKADSLGGRMPDIVGRRLRELGVRRVPYYGMEFVRRATPGVLRPFVGRNVWGPRLPGMRGMMRELDTLEIATAQWRACVEQAHQDARSIPTERVLELHIEDLTKSSLADLLAFCELADDDGVRQAFDHYFDARPQQRQTTANAERLETVRRQIQPTMMLLGYPQDTMT